MIVRCLVLAGLLLLGTVTTAAPADGAHAGRAEERSGCSFATGSGPRRAGPRYDEHELRGARVGRHACFDRLVIDFGIFDYTPYDQRDGGAPGFTVKYVDQVRHPGGGPTFPLAGRARLDIVIEVPNTCGYRCEPGYPGTVLGRPLPGVDVSGFRTFRSTVYAGTLNGITRVHLGLGVRARLPFRVTKLDERLVIDVAHTW